MTGFFVRRTFWIFPVLITVGLVTFVLMHRAPGGPWDREKPLPAATMAALNKKFGLDKPLWFNPAAVSAARTEGVSNPFTLARAFVDTQFFNYMFGAAKGDLGPSYQARGARSVQSVIQQKFPYSLRVGLVAIVFAILVGLPLGLIGALKQNSILDYVSLFVATIGSSVPTFVVGVLLIIFLSRQLGVQPIRRPQEWQGFGTAYLLPGIVLGLGTMAFLTRLMRSTMLEIKRQDFIRTARAKGLSETRVIGQHMVRNGLIPVITVLGPALADLVTGSFIIESIFGVPGIGAELVKAIAARDYSMIMGITLFFALLVAVANLVVDLSYGLLDPRIRARR